jgi:acyl-CoA synthetase (AMP-forming)/AMP-acid ligase II
MAVSFVAIAAGATACPLNPAYRADEFEFYLSDLNAKALVVEAGSTSASIGVAKKSGVRVFTLTPGAAAGSFTLTEEGGSPPPAVRAPASTPAPLGGLVASDSKPPPRPQPSTAPLASGLEDSRHKAVLCETPRTSPADAGEGAKKSGMAHASDIALILHTSGTTSRPKIVPLSQANVCASACNVRDTLKLVPQDCGLNIMPMFHIHGLIAGLLAPLAAGSKIFCSPGFNALKFFSWMPLAKPTWYTAVPTMHQTILARAAQNKDTIAAHPLKFLRSSSSSIPPQVIAELEAVFNAPLIESYGMTEAAHQMASNPLPPATRKPGTVGVAAGPEVAIMDLEGSLLPAGSTGEIVIKGPNVTAGYENNPKANGEAFTHGWFRTGAQGVLDADGYLSITGRLKEIINRGGEKISPREVDEVLMDHAAVAQVVTFAVPHDKLGEDVAAAVVLKEGVAVTEKELRDFVAQRLVDFKVPRKILLLDEIPKGATGKLQRIGLAQKLGLA